MCKNIGTIFCTSDSRHGINIDTGSVTYFVTSGENFPGKLMISFSNTILGEKSNTTDVRKFP